MAELTLVKFIRPDRGPQGCYAPGDIAGFEPHVAKKLIAQGFAEPHDAGKGPGKVNPASITHLREDWETDDAYAARAPKGRAA
jgi:hypothetical protein